MEERRKYIRFNAPFCVRYTDRNTTQESPGVIKDISYKGVRIMLDAPKRIASSSVANLVILFPENTFQIEGQVKWIRSFGTKKEVGLCFLNTPTLYKDTIHNYIKKQKESDK